jgi:hypothetical protein
MVLACEQLGESHARALRQIEQLTEAQRTGRRLDTAVLLAYQSEAETAAEYLERFRLMIQEFKARLTVH